MTTDTIACIAALDRAQSHMHDAIAHAPHHAPALAHLINELAAVRAAVRQLGRRIENKEPNDD